MKSCKRNTPKESEQQCFYKISTQESEDILYAHLSTRFISEINSDSRVIQYLLSTLLLLCLQCILFT